MVRPKPETYPFHHIWADIDTAMDFTSQAREREDFTQLPAELQKEIIKLDRELESLVDDWGDFFPKKEESC